MQNSNRIDNSITYQLPTLTKPSMERMHTEPTLVITLMVLSLSLSIMVKPFLVYHPPPPP
jgi:hypothetical protein